MCSSKLETREPQVRTPRPGAHRLAPRCFPGGSPLGWSRRPLTVLTHHCQGRLVGKSEAGHLPDRDPPGARTQQEVASLDQSQVLPRLPNPRPPNPLVHLWSRLLLPSPGSLQTLPGPALPQVPLPTTASGLSGHGPASPPSAPVGETVTPTCPPATAMEGTDMGLCRAAPTARKAPAPLC